VLRSFSEQLHKILNSFSLVSDGRWRWVGLVEGALNWTRPCELQGCGWLQVGRAMLIVLYNCVIIDSKDDGLTWWMRSKAALTVILRNDYWFMGPAIFPIFSTWQHAETIQQRNPTAV